MRGFTLIELAVVIAIGGLLLGVILPTAARQFETRQARETRDVLGEIKEALIGVAISRDLPGLSPPSMGRLPCPDTDGDGLENRSSVSPFSCTALVGELPYVNLSTPTEDAWGEPFQYQVTSEFTYQVKPGMPPAPLRLDLQDIGDITIQVHDFNWDLVNVSTTAPARVWSARRDELQIWLSRHRLVYRLVLSHQLP